MAITLTIGGVSKQYVVGSLDIKFTLNGRSTASFDVASLDGLYRPSIDAEVIIEEDAVRIFGGLIDKPAERGRLGEKTGSYPGINTRVSAVDFNHYLERRYFSGTLSAGTLKSRLQYLITNYLGVYGVTLHGSQVDGPTLPERPHNYRILTEVVREEMALTGESGQPYVLTIDHNKVLRAYQPSTEAAPFDITVADQSNYGDVTVDQSRQQYGNRIIVKVPSTSEDEHIETFVGDGSTTTFTPSSGWTVKHGWGYVTVDGTNHQTLGPTGDPDDPSWELDANGSITSIDGAPNSGAIISFKFAGIYDGTATAEDASATTNPYERLIQLEEVPPDQTIDSLAESYLAKSLVVPKIVSYRTNIGGLRPGQTQTITLPLRDLDDSFVITDVTVKDRGTSRLTYRVSATAGDYTLDGFRDIYKLWSGELTGGGAAPTTTAPTPFASPGGAAPPLRSNQFNRNNVFGGNASWLFHEEFKTVMLGTNHIPAGLNNMLIGRGHRVMDSGSFSAALETMMYPFDAAIYDVGGLYDDGGSAGPIA